MNYKCVKQKKKWSKYCVEQTDQLLAEKSLALQQNHGPWLANYYTRKEFLVGWPVWVGEQKTPQHPDISVSIDPPCLVPIWYPLVNIQKTMENHNF